MSARRSLMFENGLAGIPVDLRDLPLDLKRVLRVQFKELIHTIDDARGEVSTNLHSYPYIARDVA